MRKILYIMILLISTLFFGCNRNEIPDGRKVKINLSGAMQTPSSGIRTKGERGEGMINPIPDDPDDPDDLGDYRGLPPHQLFIGIVTIELDQDTDPEPEEWESETAYLDPGFFGGNYIGDTPDELIRLGGAWNGNIEYTNVDRSAIQQVFYNESGVYYYFVCIYPHDFVIIKDTITDGGVNTGSEGAWVLFRVDGSQDIMASDMGSGNIDNQFHDTLTFHHKLTALRCNFIAESELAATLYGSITSVELVNQPSVLKLNVGQSAIRLSGMSPVTDSTYISYPAVRPSEAAGALSLPYLPTNTTYVEFGYIIAMPAQTYTFKITTSARGANNPFYGTYNFGATLPDAGTVYNLNFKMLETAEIMLEVGDPENWNFEQIYD